MSKITNAMLMEAINGINTKLDAIDKRVTTLEKGKSKPTTSAKGKPSATATPTVKVSGFSTNIKDYEPKKVDGFYKWGKKTDTIKSRNYRAMMVAYCYAVATKGEALGCYKDGKKVCDFDDIKEAYYKAQADFKATYKYTKVADR